MHTKQNIQGTEYSRNRGRGEAMHMTPNKIGANEGPSGWPLNHTRQATQALKNAAIKNTPAQKIKKIHLTGL
jgi:hypothetical protein